LLDAFYGLAAQGQRHPHHRLLELTIARFNLPAASVASDDLGGLEAFAVAGDNFAYVASYTTVKWQGNLEARTINLKDGTVSGSATWCAENVVTGSCSAPGNIVADTSGGSTVYNCVTPNSTAGTCSGVLDGTNCKVEMPVACTGTMAAKVGASTDTRTIKMQGSGTFAGRLVDFSYGNLSATQQGYFTGTSLSQWSSLDTTQQGKASNANLVNYLRGQTGFEDRASNLVNGVDNRIFRYREATLGDAVESQPAYVGKPFFNYTDPGYSAFVTNNAGRAKTVFVGTNDGMLHAFNADDGTERWAYVPSMVISNLWRLADKNYGSNHFNYVNGRPIIADVYDPAANAGAGAWRSILVGGLNGGGRGYYALDITDPATPTLLWEIDSSAEANLGYSFGYPVITKKADGTWVVLFTSGYNNTSPGDGQGYLFVRNALTGAHISRIGTGAGDGTTPSGLAKIASWSNDPSKNNTSVYVYGGDLLGNLWRFDINANTVMNFAVLKDSSGVTQPITIAPELGLINSRRVVFVGTGKYLETSDLTTTQQQTLYAIKDENSATTLVNPRLNMVGQTLTTSGATRTATANKVDFNTKLGWYVNLPDSGERVHVDPILDSGLLIVASTVPSATVCLPGGYGWLNYFSYATGSNGQDIVSQQFNGSLVGINVYYIDGIRYITGVTADDPTPKKPPIDIPNPPNSSFVGKKVIWRELIP
jgi:type IV pilus assembly protein PilY1